MIGNDLDNGFILLNEGDDTVDAAGGNDLSTGATARTISTAARGSIPWATSTLRKG